jgi:hypothetical protein
MGMSVEKDSGVYTLDIVTPQLSIDKIDLLAEQGGMIKIRVSLLGERATQDVVQLLINDEVYGEYVISALGDIEFNAVPLGSYAPTVTVRISDVAGNVVSATRDFNIDVNQVKEVNLAWLEELAHTGDVHALNKTFLESLSKDIVSQLSLNFVLQISCLGLLGEEFFNNLSNRVISQLSLNKIKQMNLSLLMDKLNDDWKSRFVSLTKVSYLYAQEAGQPEVSLLENKVLGVGDFVDIELTFNSVVYFSSKENRYLNLSNYAKAYYLGGEGSNKLIFRYVVAANENTSNVLVNNLHALDLKDAMGVLVNLGGDSLIAEVTLSVSGSDDYFSVNLGVADEDRNITDVEKQTGLSVTVDFSNPSVQVGDKVEILLNGHIFSYLNSENRTNTIYKILEASDIAANRVTFVLPYNDDGSGPMGWNDDGQKILSAKVYRADNLVGVSQNLVSTVNATLPYVENITTNVGDVITQDNHFVTFIYTFNKSINQLGSDAFEVQNGLISSTYGNGKVWHVVVAPTQNVSGKLVLKLKQNAVMDEFSNRNVGSSYKKEINTENPSALLYAPSIASTPNHDTLNNGLLVTLNLAGTNLKVGDMIEVLLDGVSFSNPFVHTLALNEINAHSVTLTIPALVGWGNQDEKRLTVRTINTLGNKSVESPALILQIRSLGKDFAFSNKIWMPALRSNKIVQEDVDSGVDVIVDLTGLSLVAGDKIQLILNGIESNITQVTLTENDITRQRALLNLRGNPGVVVGAMPTVLARVLSVDGVTGYAGGNVVTTLDQNIFLLPSSASWVGGLSLTELASLSGGLMQYIPTHLLSDNVLDEIVARLTTGKFNFHLSSQQLFEFSTHQILYILSSLKEIVFYQSMDLFCVFVNALHVSKIVNEVKSLINTISNDRKSNLRSDIRKALLSDTQTVIHGRELPGGEEVEILGDGSSGAISLFNAELREKLREIELQNSHAMISTGITGLNAQLTELRNLILANPDNMVQQVSPENFVTLVRLINLYQGISFIDERVVALMVRVMTSRFSEFTGENRITLLNYMARLIPRFPEFNVIFRQLNTTQDMDAILDPWLRGDRAVLPDEIVLGLTAENVNAMVGIRFETLWEGILPNPGRVDVTYHERLARLFLVTPFLRTQILGLVHTMTVDDTINFQTTLGATMNELVPDTELHSDLYATLFEACSDDFIFRLIRNSTRFYIHFGAIQNRPTSSALRYLRDADVARVIDRVLRLLPAGDARRFFDGHTNFLIFVQNEIVRRNGEGENPLVLTREQMRAVPNAAITALDRMVAAGRNIPAQIINALPEGAILVSHLNRGLRDEDIARLDQNGIANLVHAWNTRPVLMERLDLTEARLDQINIHYLLNVLNADNIGFLEAYQEHLVPRIISLTDLHNVLNNLVARVGDRLPRGLIDLFPRDNLQNYTVATLAVMTDEWVRNVLAENPRAFVDLPLTTRLALAGTRYGDLALPTIDELNELPVEQIQALEAMALNNFQPNIIEGLNERFLGNLTEDTVNNLNDNFMDRVALARGNVIALQEMLTRMPSYFQERMYWRAEIGYGAVNLGNILRNLGEELETPVDVVTLPSNLMEAGFAGVPMDVYNGAGETIAVIDSAIAADAFNNVLTLPRAGEGAGNEVLDFNDHGTQVAGVIANELQTVFSFWSGTRVVGGGAGGATILSLATRNGMGSFQRSEADRIEDMDNIADLIYVAIRNHATIINLSLGYFDRTTLRLQQALLETARNGVMVVIAAGNGDGDTPWIPEYPARFALTDALVLPNVIAVGGNPVGGRFTNFHQAGQRQFAYVTAPAINVLTRGADGRLARVSGTSFAAPMVAALGAIARQVLLRRAPTLTAVAATNRAVQAIVRSTNLFRANIFSSSGAPRRAQEVDTNAPNLQTTSISHHGMDLDLLNQSMSVFGGDSSAALEFMNNLTQEDVVHNPMILNSVVDCS